MTPTRRRLLGTAAGTVAFAGCVSDDGDDDNPSQDVTTDPMATDMTTTDDSTSNGGGSATLQVRANPDLGDVLVGPGGLTLYMFDQDTRGEAASTCYESCTESWPPLTVDGEPTAGDEVATDLRTFERDDESTQVAANGWPLYYFAGDEEPGDATGQGLNDVWWVLDPEGMPVRDGESPTPTATETDTTTDDGGDSGY